MVRIFSSLGSEMQKPICLRKTSYNNMNHFCFHKGILSVDIIQRSCLCLVTVLPLLVSDVSELSFESLHLSMSFLSRTASVSWILSALLPGHCSVWGWRCFFDPLHAWALSNQTELNFSLTRLCEACTTHSCTCTLLLDEVHIDYDTWHNNLHVSSYRCFLFYRMNERAFLKVVFHL